MAIEMTFENFYYIHTCTCTVYESLSSIVIVYVKWRLLMSLYIVHYLYSTCTCMYIVHVHVYVVL